ncbi:hypothetical protein NRK68_33740 [Streptomyces yangpuensis]|uniref:Uncharacterized protein n=1 Tax=Streptomyces yangpuensis TaxID=1648182 RepID=A0ABY5Q6D2_9ACTN|nr:hypothetical protein [Streptomyces yangpuensis]UUY51774.1 hypothetical protein NRK68_33740 [Streptomyces yangpuensis]
MTNANGPSPITAAGRFTYDPATTAPATFAAISPTPISSGWNTTSPAHVNIGALDGACGFGVVKTIHSA